jgi:glycosidase
VVKLFWMCSCTAGCNPDEEFRKYWGGDIQGIEEKLAYVQRLGASAIWVTPLAENGSPSCAA